MPVTVHFVTDPAYGNRVNDLLPLGPVWIVESHENSNVARTIWDEKRFDGLTTYSNLGLTPEEQVFEMFETVDEHFDIETFRVIGVLLNDRVREYIASEGFENFSESCDGFTAIRRGEEI